MKKLILLFLFTGLFSISISAQSASDVKVGDTFLIGEATSNNYKYIKFPKSNIVIKKGGIVDYSKIVGKEVEITSIKEKKGVTIATIALTSGKRFFNSHKYVNVDINNAVSEKELSRQ